MTDEMKPVRCGCGGEAVIYVMHWWGKCYVCECEECGTASRPCTTEAEAVKAWNRAMSVKDINVPNKYEYHIDHTDCIWYWNGKGKCPSTCSQYRDGWNDAMDYIYKNGKGYSPYRRGGNE